MNVWAVISTLRPCLTPSSQISLSLCRSDFPPRSFPFPLKNFSYFVPGRCRPTESLTLFSEKVFVSHSHFCRITTQGPELLMGVVLAKPFKYFTPLSCLQTPKVKWMEEQLHQSQGGASRSGMEPMGGGDETQREQKHLL